MTREELKAHCLNQIEMCKTWAVGKGEEPSGKIYEEHKLILELLEQEPRKGKWIKEKSIYGWDGRSYQCSVCGRSIHLDIAVEDLADYPYCHCGADMREVEE